MALLTPQAIANVAGRIERAYSLRFDAGPWGGPGPRLWEVVARALFEAHRAAPWLPLDPELFVASQPTTASPSDPWAHMEPGRAVRRYRRRIRRIARGLRRELVDEVRLAGALMGRGRSLEWVLDSPRRDLSPLGRYIVAYRHGRPDLAEGFRRQAQDQHAGCPLYRLACRRLLPESAYPVVELLPGLISTPRVGPAPHTTSAN